MKKNTDKVLMDILNLFLVWRLSLFLVSCLFYFGLPQIPNINSYKDLSPLISSWLYNDSGWFLTISNQGYWNPSSTAFFPFWPILIALASKVFFFLDYRIIGLILSNLITLTNCWLLYLLVKKDYDSSVAYRAVKYFLFFPTSFYLITAYSESLFLLTVLLSFYFLRTQFYFYSGISALLSSLTKPFGTLLCIPLIINLIIIKHKFAFKKIFLLLLPLLGVPFYMVFLKLRFDNFFIFLEAQAQPGWEAELGLRGFSKLYYDLQAILTWQIFNVNLISILQTSGLFLILWFFLFANLNKINLAYFSYSLSILLLTISSNSLLNMPRYALLIFPLFIILGTLGRSRRIDDFITIFFLILLSFYAGLFILGGWVS